MEKIIELHKIDYESKEFDRVTSLYDAELAGFECYIDNYFNPTLLSLEIGTGGRRVVAAFERDKISVSV